MSFLEFVSRHLPETLAVGLAGTVMVLVAIPPLRRSGRTGTQLPPSDDLLDVAYEVGVATAGEPR